jgi:solute carrier family 8 (sodium/calcium exchanger)
MACDDVALLSYACSGHLDCCIKLASDAGSSYPPKGYQAGVIKPDVCMYGTYADYDYAAACCTTSALEAALPWNPGYVSASWSGGVSGWGEFAGFCRNQDSDSGREACEFAEPSICCPGGSGVFLPQPALGDEYWSVPLRGTFYLLFLGWLFLGIMVISDIFMAAIEEITSAKIEKYKMIDGVRRRYFVDVWNPTVANLSLMALGSSAPEILLSLVELAGRNYYSGALGASTIVGSAAFNLFSITAVCIMAIPEGEVRYIEQMQVYKITLSFSLFAYTWILVVLQGTSPDVITIPEAVLTFLFFPLLLWLAFRADIGKLCPSKPTVAPVTGTPTYVVMDNDEDAKMLKKQYTVKYGDAGKQIEDEALNKLVAKEKRTNHSRAYYRVQATKRVVSGQKASAELETRARASIAVQEKEAEDPNQMVIEFEKDAYSVLEGDEEAVITLCRSGPTTEVVVVDWKTRDGTAVAGSDYHAGSGTVTFGVGEDTKEIKFHPIDDDLNEPDKDCYIDLTLADNAPKLAKLGDIHSTTVTIIDDDIPGVIYFTEDDFYGSNGDEKVVVHVSRRDGCSADVSCSYKFDEGTAKAGTHFEDVGEEGGKIVFKKGEITKDIEISLINSAALTNTVSFAVLLENPEGGATFDEETEGGAESCMAKVTVGPKDTKTGGLKKAKTNVIEDIALGSSSWKDGFVQAVYVNGSYEDQKEAGIADIVFHFFALPFKLVFALTPPTSIAQGYPAFVVSLVFIGICTAVVGDVAAIFGCVCGVPDEITAITFVALGTSLPDTFASMTAALEEPYADASVGNVTGSNSVNVFLGLGLAWMIGAFFWENEGATLAWKARYSNAMVTGGSMSIVEQYPGGGFVVPAGSLGFSVAVYTGLAGTACAFLAFRRSKVGGELGGSGAFKKISAGIFFGFWLAYVGANIAYFVVQAS